MQTNKHTSGPWFRTVSQHNGETVYDICTAADNGEPKEMIARVNHCVITPGLAISDEVRANARLIAAAPDMLEALVAMLKRDELNTCQHEDTHRGGAIWEICDGCGAKWADDRGGKPTWEDPNEWVLARAAIRKAKGES